MIVTGRLIRSISRLFMNRRQRRTVNFFSRYVIDDQAVEKSKVAEAEAKADTAMCDWSKAVSGEVTDKLRLKSADLKELHDQLDLENGRDRRLAYLVTGIKLDNDTFNSDSDFDSDDSSKSDSSSSDGEGNDSVMIRSPSSANSLSSGKAGTPSSKSKLKK